MKIRNRKLTLITSYSQLAALFVTFILPLTTSAFGTSFIVFNKYSFCKIEPVLSVYIDLDNKMEK